MLNMKRKMFNIKYKTHNNNVKYNNNVEYNNNVIHINYEMHNVQCLM